MRACPKAVRQKGSKYCFGEFGQQGYGYNVEELRTEIGHILGVDNHHHLIMIEGAQMRACPKAVRQKGSKYSCL